MVLTSMELTSLHPSTVPLPDVFDVPPSHAILRDTEALVITVPKTWCLAIILLRARLKPTCTVEALLSTATIIVRIARFTTSAVVTTHKVSVPVGTNSSIGGAIENAIPKVVVRSDTVG